MSLNQCVKIRKTVVNNKTTFVVPVQYIFQNNEKVAIPSPSGTDIVAYDSLKEAEDAVYYSGYSYILVESDDKNNSSSYQVQNYTDEDFLQIVELFLQNLGDENINIRNASIDALVQFGSSVFDRLIDSLNNSSWLVRYSTVLCIEKIADVNPTESTVFIKPLMVVVNDKNTMVKASAISALAKICKNNKK